MCVKRNQLALIAVVAATISQTLVGTTTSAQSTEPLLLPRLSFSDLSYAGGFRLPAETSNGHGFGFGGQAVAFNAATPSLFVSSRLGQVAEVGIPAPVISADVNDMPFAQYLQGFADPTEGRLNQVWSSGVWTNSLLVRNGRLYGTASIYYDALNEQRVSHFSRSLNLNDRSFQGWSQVWETAKAGFVAGNLASVPAEWQSRLGGAMASGQCCVPIISRTSWGPSAFAFDPASIGQPVVAASPLLYYTGDHPTLGVWGSSNDNYGASTEISGMVLVAGTRTVLYFGRNGLGPYCYGKGTADRSLAGTTDPADGGHWCYDPTSPFKGTHAYPYRYQIWAYDLNDLAAVKAGTKNPWEVLPYDVWPFAFPTEEARISLGGVSYDAQTQTIFVAQGYADADIYEPRPIIHVLRVNPTGQPLAPIPTSPSTQVTSVSMQASVAAPQPAGTAITFTASAVGGSLPRQYKWMTSADGVSWSGGAWLTSDRFTWTPTTASSQYKVRVWARSGSNAADRPEALATASFPIEPAVNPVTGLTVSANKNPPQKLGTAITFSASATGGDAPNQFKWLVLENGSWVTRADWSAASTFTWTPSAAGSQFQIAVWGRSGRSTDDRAQALATMTFPIEEANNANPVTAVTLTANKVAPQQPGTAITFSATASGGTGHNEFKWLVFDGSGWVNQTNWGTPNTFTWTPSAANPQYQVRVWARSARSRADQPQALATVPFSIGSPNTVTAPVSKLTVTSTPSPQPAGTALSFVATPVGGTAPYQYKWYTYDGAGWTVRADWSSSNTFTWTPMSPSDRFQIEVWVRSAGNTNHLVPEAFVNVPFVITPR
jgi:hypothetical protein